jgi:hypothetical protein
MANATRRTGVRCMLDDTNREVRRTSIAYQSELKPRYQGRCVLSHCIAGISPSASKISR